MISEQVVELRIYAAEYGREIEGSIELLNKAADTIEALFTKLAAMFLTIPNYRRNS